MRKNEITPKLSGIGPDVKFPPHLSRDGEIPSLTEHIYTIISHFLTYSGNVKRLTGLYPVEIYLFKANNNNSKTKYEICPEF